MRMAICHPERKHFCRNLCRSCYNTLHKRRKRGTVKKATCHPDREDASQGRCHECYAALRGSAKYVQVRTRVRARCINHPDKVADGRSLCKACYTVWRRKQDPARNVLERKKDRAAVYGISLSEYERLKSQDRCTLCNKYLPTPPDRHIDHCHATGTVRGVLCFTCNKGLGMLGDNEAGLLRALAYIRRGRKESL